AYLSRASEINDSWNSTTKATDLAAIGPLCDAVIASHPLAPNYGDLWRYTAPNGANENLREVILSAQFTSDLSASGQNTQHLYYVSRYEDIAQMQRDLSGDRPFSRLCPNFFMYRIYDLQNDSRFWKTFRTKHKVNAASPTAPYVQGDLGIMYVINQPGDTRFSANLLNNSVVYSGTGKTIPHVYVAYRNGQTADGGWNDTRRFPSLSKFMDGSRTAGFNDVDGLRDITLARSAETYLIAAEAKIRLAKLGTGSYNDALPYINAVRARAQYINGESRSVYYDGGAAPSAAPQTIPPSFFPENSYYESNNIPVTTAASASLAVSNIATLPAGDEYIINVLGLSSTYDRMLAFLLNERSRELAGEYLRWQDLSRTKTLVQRAKAFNPDATPNVQDRHLLRPIPQNFLDAIQRNGVALTPAEKQAMQNPGY
ncbi:MAG TPA: RagB/SusD family nutrient uptake outer membrane protein, partial [Chitinophagaceae bacterium]|nr:RagB/SusD family nutrient uptake outer membrane protein [Chitinophagaceae bacterium]